MVPQERHKRFGQYDHYRWIGRRDFNLDMYNIAALTGSEPLRDAAEILGPEIMDRISGDRDVYVLRKAP
jgi:hypothetical protein